MVGTRGLLYIHQNSQYDCSSDQKSTYVFPDIHMIPKIVDFGKAGLFS